MEYPPPVATRTPQPLGCRTSSLRLPLHRFNILIFPHRNVSQWPAVAVFDNFAAKFGTWPHETERIYGSSVLNADGSLSFANEYLARLSFHYNSNKEKKTFFFFNLT